MIQKVPQLILINDANIVKILFYIDIGSAITLFSLSWYLNSIWLLASGVISLAFAAFKPMRFIFPWMVRVIRPRVEKLILKIRKLNH